MSTMRKLTVGVTVNLRNYESLRLEVSDEVEGEEGARELVRFLDRTLTLFGQESPETAELVGQYRRRVLGGLAPSTVPGDGVPIAGAPAPAPAASAPHAATPVPLSSGPTPAAPPAPGTAPGAASPAGRSTLPTATPAPESPVTPPGRAASTATPAPLTGTAPTATTRSDGPVPPPAPGAAPVPPKETPVPGESGGHGTPMKAASGSTPSSAAQPAAKAPAPASRKIVCKNCGSPVTVAEERASQLFVSRTLCKRCLQKI